MKQEIEEKFIRTFCEKRVVDRLIYELKSKNKRMDALWKFSNHMQFIKQSLVVASSNKYTPEELITEVKKLSNSKRCYILAPYADLDGLEYSLETGIKEGFYYGLATAFIIDEYTAVIKDEQCYGSPTKYILHYQTKQSQ